jgi:hypothetical protein
MNQEREEASMLFGRQTTESPWPLLSYSVLAVLIAAVVGGRAGSWRTTAALGCTLTGTLWLAFAFVPTSPDWPDCPGRLAWLKWIFSPTRGAPLVFVRGRFYGGLLMLAIGAIIGACS